MLVGTLGQCLGAGRSSAEIPRQAFSGVALSQGQTVRSLAGEVTDAAHVSGKL